VSVISTTATKLRDVLVLEPSVFGDARGYFFESWNARAFREATGLDVAFVQDNESRSRRGVLRGLHYQVEQSQGKLVRVTHGRVFDVCVDLRRSSPTFGQWDGIELSEENRRQMWIPAGLAHGYLVLSASADVLYKTTDFYAPAHERTILWNDGDLLIAWPLEGIREPVVSAKDAAGQPFSRAALFE
jgi:dTDP-4-dehydrorhamnose 3,5-epimerase